MPAVAPESVSYERVDVGGQRIARFGDHCMVFNSVSWETHFASAHAADVLEAIGEMRVKLVGLTELLLSPDAVEEERAELLRLIAGLEDLGLICRV
jgi:hypothetical protein